MDKRYLLFMADCFYPNGGLSDKYDSYDSLSDLKKAIVEYKSDDDLEHERITPQIYDRINGVQISYEDLKIIL